MEKQDIRILHLADIHLGASNRQLPEEKQELWSEQIWQSFSETITRSIQPPHSVHAILVVGDLFDVPNPPPSLTERVKTLFHKVEEAGVPIFLVPGNHDNLISPDSVYRYETFHGVVLLDSPQIDQPHEMIIDGIKIHVYGMAYTFLSQPPFDEFAPVDAQAVNIALIHGSVVHSPEWKQHAQDVPLDKEKLFRTGFDYIALGHYHNFQIWQKDGRFIVYPGSLEPLGWKETAQRNPVLLHITTDGLQVTSFPGFTPRRRYQTLEVNCTTQGWNSQEELIQYICKEFNHPDVLLHVVLQGSCSFLPEVERIRSRCQETLFFVKITDNTRFVSMEWLNRLQEEKTIRGMSIRKLLELEGKASSEEKEIIQEAMKILLGYFTVD